MSKKNEQASVSLTGRGRYINCGTAALLMAIVAGCASVSKPVIIRHESTPSMSDVATSRQSAKEPADQMRQGSASQPTEASPGQHAAKSSEGTGTPAAQGAVGAPAQSVLSIEGTGTPVDQVAAAAPEQSALSSEGTGTNAAESALAAQEVHDRELIAAITARVTEEVHQKVEDEVRSEVMNEMYREIWKVNSAMKEKDQRLRFGGDIRLRYEKDLFDKNNSQQVYQVSQGVVSQQLVNTWADQDLYKYRVRFGAEARVNDQVEAVLRLATGTTTNPVSTNTSMNDYMNKDSILVDLAYIRWQPGKSLTLYGGRMPNPFFSASELVWDADLNFEGLAISAKAPRPESWTPFLTVGAFPLQQSDPMSTSDFSEHSKWLYAGQVGMESRDQKGISTKIGAAYYDFNNITGVPNEDPTHPGATDWSVYPLAQRPGFMNTLFAIDPSNSSKVGLASKFKEIDLTGTLDLGFWDPVHIVFLGDYVRNIGFVRNDVLQLTQVPNTVKDIVGYQIGVSVGYPTIQDRKQWKVYVYAKRLGNDAVLDGFTDSDFHLGGTNAKGWILGADVGLAKNYWLTARWLTADEINEPSDSPGKLSIDVLQVDVNARF
ncbi:MAG TPA: putative porin [Nitrospirota bacterium]|nr:putative porin [Nitrospirota bacterium]